jgi:hypothetical protein
LSDFRELLDVSAQMMSAMSAAHKMDGLPPLLHSSPTIFIGSQRFTLWEARCEIVRRAIEYFGKGLKQFSVLGS